MKNLKRILLVPVLALPLTAGTCTSEKVVDLVLGFPTTAEFIASGELNVHHDEADVDVREDLDLAAELDDAGVDANSVESLKVVQVFYRITQPEAGRSITDGEFEIERLNVSGEQLVLAGLSADVGAATDWVDVTDLLQPGITQFNNFLNEYLVEVQGGAPVSNTVFRYHVEGNSVPGNVPTNFRWEVKLVIQAVVAEEFEIPFG